MACIIILWLLLERTSVSSLRSGSRSPFVMALDSQTPAQLARSYSRQATLAALGSEYHFGLWSRLQGSPNLHSRHLGLSLLQGHLQSLLVDRGVWGPLRYLAFATSSHSQKTLYIPHINRFLNACAFRWCAFHVRIPNRIRFTQGLWDPTTTGSNRPRLAVIGLNSVY